MPKNNSKIIRGEFLFGALLICALLILYYAVFIRDFVNKRYFFGGDTYCHWSLNYLSLYSLKYFNGLPWWDPTMYNGYPLYYHFISGWSNYLSPFYMPSLVIFKIVTTLFNTGINGYIIFHRTLYVIGLNMIAVYLIARELVKNRWSAVFTVLVFTFSYFQILNFHDFYALEAMIAPLFYVYGLIRYNNRRNAANLLILVLLTSLLLASLDNGIAMSALFWSTIFSILMVVFNSSIISDTVRIISEIKKSRLGKIMIIASIVLLCSAFIASWLPLHYNLHNVIKYRGGKLDYKAAGAITSAPITIEKSEIWTILFNWFPFPEIHNFLNFAWHGHAYRYIGLATLPLIIAAFTLALRNSYVYIFSLTYFLCNGFIIYTQDNLFYRVLIDSSDLIRNTRNMETIFPRGGPIIFLLFLACIGLDALLNRKESVSLPQKSVFPTKKFFVGELRLLTLVGIILLIGLIPASRNNYVQLRGTLAHMGIYIIMFSFLCRALFIERDKKVRSWMLICLFIFTFTDLIISASNQIDARTAMAGDKKDPRGELHGRIPYLSEMAIPEGTAFHLANNEKENIFPPGYKGTYHNTGEIMWGVREWLALATSDKGKKFLTNWNPNTIKMISYPRFQLYTNGYYVPLEKINEIDSDPAILDKEPLFYLHNEALVSSLKVEPHAIAGSYDLTRYTPQEVLMQIKIEQQAYLCFLDNYDRFWFAYVDDKPVKVHRANFCFKAIWLPQGLHKVRWIYNPYPIKFGYGVFYSTLLFFVILFSLFRKENKMA